MSSHTSDSIEIRVMRVLARRSKSQLGQALLKDPSSVLRMGFSHELYTSAASHSVDWLLYNFLRKWTGFDTSLEASKAAVDSWRAAELKCFQTNCRLRQLEPAFKGRELDFIMKVRRKIELVIGTKVQYKTLERMCRWSGGATFAHKRGAVPAEKIEKNIDVTPYAENHCRVGLYCPYTADSHCSPELNFSQVQGNRLVLVPKTALTDRPIACEPSANAFAQQGVGRYIRRHLKRVGVHLDDQSHNQKAAFHAYADGLATLDLSSASDTLSISTVELLLPRAWFRHLCRIRSPATLVDGKWVLLEKFSSMGNAFTFELETLIFWAICSELSEYCLVYGDDIIVKSDDATSVMEALSFFGFIINEEKSFWSGSFFESCGKHYYELEDVTPAYQKEKIDTKDSVSRLSGLVRLHNRLLKWSLRTKNHNLVKDALHILREEGRRVLGVINAKRSKPASGSRVKKKPLGLPEIPYFGDDRGFWTKDLLGDKRLWVLGERLDYEPYTSDLEKLALALKLRSPAVSNTMPDGTVARETGRRTILHRARVWQSSLTSD